MQHVLRGGGVKVYTGFWLGNLERRKTFGRPWRRWVDNIKMDLQEVGREGMNWTDLTQHRNKWRALIYAVMNLRVP